MKKIKAIFNRRKGWLKSIFSHTDDKTSSDSTLHAQPDLAPEVTPAIRFPDGVEVLHNCVDARVDIYFIHGLTGNRDSTWTGHGQLEPWPKTLLPSRLPRARILTYGYDAYVLRAPSGSSNRLIDHAMNLLNDLTRDRARNDASSRPLIFVAHSLGGLVCKEAILLSRNNPEPHLRGIFDCTKGIIFIGTPHKGSWMASWAKIPASALGLINSGNKALLDVLQTDNQLLESVQVRFWSMIREVREAGRRLEVTCFFEELGLVLVGKIVSKESATLEGYSSFSIHANHSDMAKFSSAEDNGFDRLLGELVRWESQIEDSTVDQPSPSSAEEAPVDKPASTTINNFGSGEQFYAVDGVQNNALGSGNQFPGATFNGPMYFS
ncbi:uncharacterized protein GIQ15_04840 [Arthroderma uncinatum]|uniref:uncharacterized protein n=1 Tax=Arthroderma uncinatum TaxID=74035 RepID=UPI00144A79ED|nr:uncharacterized protein GIQ15_04840 [Arthroderma uncinatum]KAF3482081.1 hypothetical protein GIQ15_04840 [Arthroderma uncinatum]